MNQQNLFVLWASWNVWRTFIKEVLEKDLTNSGLWHMNPSKIIWISNSSNYNVDINWIEPHLLKEILNSRESAKRSLENKSPYSNINEIIGRIEDSSLSWDVIFVDLTAGKEDMLDFHKKIITETDNWIVTANKNPISLYDMDDFKKLTEYHHRYWANTTVMWWWWALDFVNQTAETEWQANIYKIEWIFSGTLWYIFSEFEKWIDDFSEIVKKAKEKWFTEPNPYDDLNWLDVARKMLILARYAGFDVNMEDVKVEPLIEEKFWKISDEEEFFEELEKENDEFWEKLKKAKSEWKVLRYIWEIIINNWQVKINVELKEIKQNSQIWNLKWSDNIFQITTETFPNSHTIISPWAWLEVTTNSVRRDILKQLQKGLKRF